MYCCWKKKEYLHTSVRAARAVKERSRRDPNNESALKAEPNHQFYSHTSGNCFSKDLKTVIKPSIGKGWPTKLIEEAQNRSGLPVVSLYEACSSTLNILCPVWIPCCSGILQYRSNKRSICQRFNIWGAAIDATTNEIQTPRSLR